MKLLGILVVSGIVGTAFGLGWNSDVSPRIPGVMLTCLLPIIVVGAILLFGGKPRQHER